SISAICGILLAGPKAFAQAPTTKPKFGPRVHNGLIFISGQGANDNGSVQGLDIETHTRKVLDNVKNLVEAGGGTMDSILQLTVYLATLEDYEAMNSVYRTYFPNGGPARTTVAVAGVPGHSLLEVNCIAAVVK
ncbi:MAG: RidA family protein, partial [Terriglobia bacterium]